MQIEIEVTGQKIKRLDSPGSVADTLNYLTCHFIFVGEEWDNTVRTAYFENQKSGERYAQIIADDGTCTVPWEALTDKGFVRFSAAGEREDYRITTDVESFYNSGTIYGGNPSEPPTPDQYDQLIALAEQTKEIAESVRRDADEGKFDGDPGEPGEPGKPGAPGRDGVSPTAKVEQTDDGAVITITDATGTTTAELKNGKEGNPGQNATDEQVRGAVDAYMAEHPVQVDTDDLIKIAIKEEASGAVPIAVTDSAEMGVQDLTMQGWTEQDGTPTPEAPVPIVSAGTQNQDTGKWECEAEVGCGQLLNFQENNVTLYGITCESKIDTITINGAKTNGDGGRLFYKTNDFVLQPGTYTFSHEVVNDINSAISGLFLTKKDSNEVLGRTFTLNESTEVYIGINIYEARRANDVVVRCMLNTGSTPLPYTPYRTPQTVLLTSNRPLTKWDKLRKRKGQWGWVYKSGSYTVTGEEFFISSSAAYHGEQTSDAWLLVDDMFSKTWKPLDDPGGYCEKLSWSQSIWTKDGSVGFTYNVKQIHIRLNNADVGITSEDTLTDIANKIKAYAAQKYEEGNPFIFWYETEYETFVPLSASEQEAMNALHTYYPTTVLSNDTECEMSIKYIADTKAYIDKKISAIQAAIVNSI